MEEQPHLLGTDHDVMCRALCLALQEQLYIVSTLPPPPPPSISSLSFRFLWSMKKNNEKFVFPISSKIILALEDDLSFSF